MHWNDYFPYMFFCLVETYFMLNTSRKRTCNASRCGNFYSCIIPKKIHFCINTAFNTYCSRSLKV